jgi:hypothetical protein
LFILRATLAIVIPLGLALPFVLGFGFISVLTAPGCGGGQDPAGMGWNYEDVSFPSSEFPGQMIPAYWIPAADPTSGLSVILVPTGVARGGRLDEAAAYHAAGVNVLTYSARTCLAPVTNSLGYHEVDAVGDALAYLNTRGDVDPNQIGLHGFSAGGAAAIMAAARFNEQIAWLVSEGGYHNFNAEIDENSLTHLPLGLGALFRLGALFGYRVAVGVDMSVLSPVDAIDDIDAPVLLIYGTREPSLAGAREMQRIGGENIRLWEVPGATHGGYIAAAGAAEYEERIKEFLTTENTENTE